MKVAFVLGDFCVGNRPLDFNVLWNGERGLTGTELSITEMARHFVTLGHDVSLFTMYTGPQPPMWEKVKLYTLEQLPQIVDASFDACVCMCEPDQLRKVPESIVRVCFQQLNGFSYCKPGFDTFVDSWISPSEIHMQYSKSWGGGATEPSKWSVVANGCDPSWYAGKNKVYGRFVWSSSADRGLHWLLSEWSKIKEAVPEATLRIFYNFNFGNAELHERPFSPFGPDILETGQRVRYMREMIKKLEPLGVENYGSTSRDRINKEIDEAMIFAYPCSVITFTEGFSVSLLENLCAGNYCVSTDVDALGGVYGESGMPLIKSPLTLKNIHTFTEQVIKGLKDEKHRNSVIKKTKAFAKKLTWMDTSKKVEAVIKQNSKFRGK